jgi:hypothetical protein
MKKLITIPILIFVFSFSSGQTPVGSWSDHLFYNTAKGLAIGSKNVFASTGSSIILYDKEYDETRKLSRINGLSETGISSIAWSEDYKTLIIGYSSTNIDLITDNVVYNIPDIKMKYLSGKKEINRIRVNGRYAYLACSFGIVLVDIIKKEISDTWKPGNGTETAEVFDIAFGDGKVYVATGSGLFTAGLSNPGLSFFGNWSLLRYLPKPGGKYNCVLYSGNKLYINRSEQNFKGDSVYVVSTACSLFSFTPGVFNNSFDNASSGFTISSGSSARYYNSDGKLVKNITSFDASIPNISQAVEDNGDIWIADINSGLIKGESMNNFTIMTIPGPVSNNSIYVTSLNGKTIICGGAVDNAWNNIRRPMQVSVYESGNWTSLDPGLVMDPMRAIIDPADNTHYFISSWGWGLLEYRNNQLENRYTEANSPLQTIIAGSPYVRICGIAFDKKGNLWLIQSEVEGNIKMLKSDGTWVVNPVTLEVPTVADMIVTERDQKWVILPRGNGLFVLDDKGTPDDFSDDVYKNMLVQDAEGSIISGVYSIAEDLEGNIWVGTDQGPVVYYNPDKIFEEDLKAYRIKIPRKDGSNQADYLLKTETITSIAVDGANRKWLGTYSSGVYLVSPDGTQRLKNYNEQNSPILSNSIASIAVDSKTGDVWFGTSKGLISVRGDATTGKDKFEDVYAFPNPVREDFTGNITITGLMKDTQVKITDISGNLVYETESAGGQASWDLNTYTGKRVTTGVYLVFYSNGDGTKSDVIKILVIN